MHSQIDLAQTGLGKMQLYFFEPHWRKKCVRFGLLPLPRLRFSQAHLLRRPALTLATVELQPASSEALRPAHSLAPPLGDIGGPYYYGYPAPVYYYPPAPYYAPYGWLALVAALHAIRDCLGRDEAVCLGTELPTLLRGFYYEGWHPRTRRLTSREAFLERIRDGLKHDLAVDAEVVARAVMLEIARRLPAAALEDAKAATPLDIHGLWPS